MLWIFSPEKSYGFGRVQTQLASILTTIPPKPLMVMVKVKVEFSLELVSKAQKEVEVYSFILSLTFRNHASYV
jgi:hypothetical protein